MTIKATPPAPIKRIYPHVGEVEDWRAAQTIRLLWDRIHDLTEQLTAASATITQLVSGHNANETAVAAASQAAQQALASGQIAAAAGNAAGGGTGGGLPGGGDGGDGQTGCAAAGASGHDSGGLLTAIRAGQIICGTGNEFAALKNPTATLAEREANAEELILRMIWHLRQGGFTAGRQKNPSGAISKDKLCVVTETVLRAYDVFSSYDTFTDPLQTHMDELGFQQMIDDTGLPD